MNSYGHLGKASWYLRPYPGLAAASVLATLLFVGAGLLAPWPMKILVDSVLGAGAAAGVAAGRRAAPPTS